MQGYVKAGVTFRLRRGGTRMLGRYVFDRKESPGRRENRTYPLSLPGLIPFPFSPFPSIPFRFEIVLDAAKLSPQEAATEVVNYLTEKKLLPEV